MNGGKDSKAPLGLLPEKPCFEIVEVLQWAADQGKYGLYDWREGRSWMGEVDAILRHIFLFKAGVDLDPESGMPHLAHALCRLMVLMEYQETHPEFDDRYKKP